MRAEFQRAACYAFYLDNMEMIQDIYKASNQLIKRQYDTEVRCFAFDTLRLIEKMGIGDAIEKEIQTYSAKDKEDIKENSTIYNRLKENSIKRNKIKRSHV